MTMSTTTTVMYLAPVAVEVDLATNTVTSVKVCDEDARIDPEWVCPPAALEIAESKDWPVWEVGV